MFEVKGLTIEDLSFVEFMIETDCANCRSTKEQLINNTEPSLIEDGSELYEGAIDVETARMLLG